MVSLDHYWVNVLASRPILFIKIDVEGYEDLVMKGGKELFTSKTPPQFLLVEYFPSMLSLNGASGKLLLEKIFAYGYRGYNCEKSAPLPTSAASAEESLREHLEKNTMTDLLFIHSSRADIKITSNMPGLLCANR